MQEVEAEFGLRCVSLLTLADLIELLATPGQSMLPAEHLDALQTYRKQYGV